MTNRIDYTVKAYKKDNRYKTGERLVGTQVLEDTTEAEVKAQIKNWAAVTGLRYEFTAAWMKVRNMMTGKEVEIAADTPWCCNPASETYWSM